MHRFESKSLQCGFAANLVRMQHFYGYFSIQTNMFAFEHNAHTALADHANRLILAAQNSPDKGVGGACRCGYAGPAGWRGNRSQGARRGRTRKQRQSVREATMNAAQILAIHAR
jgi:hypothetical protein